MNERVELTERFAEMWRKSRTDAGKSQDYMAKALGVSKKTVQNWESGLSCPSQIVGLEWFNILGLQPLCYYLEVIYPEEFKNISAEDSDERIEQALITYIKGTTSAEKRQLLFLLFGNHGSSPTGVLQMITAHLHCELRSRLNVAHNVITNYEIAESQGSLIAPNHIKPNMELLIESYENAKSAVKRRENAYSNV